MQELIRKNKKEDQNSVEVFPLSNNASFTPRYTTKPFKDTGIMVTCGKKFPRDYPKNDFNNHKYSTYKDLRSDERAEFIVIQHCIIK